MTTEQATWHCPSEIGRELADILVKFHKPEYWRDLANHFGKPYPQTEADRYDLVYRLLGCKRDTCDTCAYVKTCEITGDLVRWCKAYAERG